MRSLIVYGIFGAIILIFRWWKNTSGTKTIQGAVSTEYRNEKFGYSFTYPNTWKKKLGIFSQPGYAEISPTNGKKYSLIFWYKDSEQIKNPEDLKSFVENDAKFSESSDKTKTIAITQQKIGGLDGFAWDYHDKGGTISRAYYISDFNPGDDQNIYVWVIVLFNKTDSIDSVLADQEFKEILNSYRFVK